MSSKRTEQVSSRSLPDGREQRTTRTVRETDSERSEKTVVESRRSPLGFWTTDSETRSTTQKK